MEQDPGVVIRDLHHIHQAGDVHLHRELDALTQKWAHSRIDDGEDTG
jgi:hypothetical protein